MATNPTPTACLKCNTPLIAGAGFCGTCGTPAGSSGTPPLPPPMPPRPLAHGARQVVVPMDQQNALYGAMNLLPGLKGEVTNQSPMQVAFRIGSYLSGRWNGTIDAYQESPGRTALNVTLKPDYSSLVPGFIVFILVTVISTILIGKASVDQIYNNPNPFQMQAPGFGAYLQWWMVGLFIVLIGGLCAWLLGGPLLDKRKSSLLNALQSIGGVPAGMPGQPGMPPFGAPPQGFAPPSGPVAAPQPQQPAQATPFEQLRKLAELRDSGAISVADYDQAKAGILAKMS